MLKKTVIMLCLTLLMLMSIACNNTVETEEAAQPTATLTSTIMITPSPQPTMTPPHEGSTANHLINEKSPYLLQHAYNPVDWHPWGAEAFEKARQQDKPIFLSIGYSTCHWCHVMEDESFEDTIVGDAMNETFISIKVDREERPDIDGIYMDVAMLLNGSGGWPLNIIMTPDQKPFFAATYIPKESRFERLGLLDLTARVKEVWANDRPVLLETADQVVAALEERNNPQASNSLFEAAGPQAGLGEATLQTAYQQLSSQFDPKHGGFGTHPKFPTPHNLLFLLRYWERSGNEQALAMVETTLQAMRRGGIYDHIGFGFHRYSTDERWLLPHFEKMLYDQAMLALAYTETYQATKDEQYAEVAQEIFTYVLRDMTAPNGGFYSAEDADSEGEEGKFYLWSLAELADLLTAEEFALVETVFNPIEAGNFTEEATGERIGTNILYLNQPMAELATAQEMTNTELTQQLETIRETLFTHREARIHPHKDDKILTDWNGLMIAALAKAGRLFNEPTYTETATQAADFILTNLVDENGRLLHRYRDGEAAILANLDDYAFLTWGLLELYETTFEVRYLEAAINLTDEMLTLFADDAGGFYFTPEDGETLLLRQKEIYDGAIPSGNSVAMLNLLRLGRITANTAYESQAASLGLAFASEVERYPMGHSQLMSAVNFGVGPSYEIVIVGELNGADTQAMLTALRQQFIPNKVVLLRPPADSAPITQIAEFTEPQFMIDGKATAYVCQNYYCELPTTEVDKMLELLARSPE